MTSRSSTLREIRFSWSLWLVGFSLVCAGCQQDSLTSQRRPITGWEAPQHSKIGALRPLPEPKLLPITHFTSAQLLESSGAYEGAIHQYRKAIALSRDYVAAHQRLGMLLDRLGRFREAEYVWGKALESDPDNPTLHNNLGFHFLLQRRYDEAAGAFNEALLIDPRFDRARINLGLALAYQDDHDLALELFREVLPEADAQYNMGLVFRQRTRYRQAARAFQAALQANPFLRAADVQLAQLQPVLKELDEAERALLRARSEERAEPELVAAGVEDTGPDEVPAPARKSLNDKRERDREPQPALHEALALVNCDLRDLLQAMYAVDLERDAPDRADPEQAPTDASTKRVAASRSRPMAVSYWRRFTDRIAPLLDEAICRAWEFAEGLPEPTAASVSDETIATPVVSHRVDLREARTGVAFDSIDDSILILADEVRYPDFGIEVRAGAGKHPVETVETRPPSEPDATAAAARISGATQASAVLTVAAPAEPLLGPQPEQEDLAGLSDSVRMLLRDELEGRFGNDREVETEILWDGPDESPGASPPLWMPRRDEPFLEPIQDSPGDVLAEQPVEAMVPIEPSVSHSRTWVDFDTVDASLLAPVGPVSTVRSEPTVTRAESDRRAERAKVESDSPRAEDASSASAASEALELGPNLATQEMLRAADVSELGLVFPWELRVDLATDPAADPFQAGVLASYPIYESSADEQGQPCDESQAADDTTELNASGSAQPWLDRLAEMMTRISDLRPSGSTATRQTESPDSDSPPTQLAERF